MNSYYYLHSQDYCHPTHEPSGSSVAFPHTSPGLQCSPPSFCVSHHSLLLGINSEAKQTLLGVTGRMGNEETQLIPLHGSPTGSVWQDWLEKGSRDDQTVDRTHFSFHVLSFLQPSASHYPCLLISQQSGPRDVVLCPYLCYIEKNVSLSLTRPPFMFYCSLGNTVTKIYTKFLHLHHHQNTQDLLPGSEVMSIFYFPSHHNLVISIELIKVRTLSFIRPFQPEV